MWSLLGTELSDYLLQLIGVAKPLVFCCPFFCLALQDKWENYFGGSTSFGGLTLLGFRMLFNRI